MSKQTDPEKYFDQYLKELTPKNVAKRLIYVYVLRGDTYQDVKTSQGQVRQEYSASIGGYVNGKNIGTDKIIVQEINNKPVNEIFPLKLIYNEILEESKTLFNKQKKSVSVTKYKSVISDDSELKNAIRGLEAFMKTTSDSTEKSQLKQAINGLKALLK